MRPLTTDESKAVFAKVAEFLERNVASLLDDQHVFRLHKDRVYYLRCVRTAVPHGASAGSAVQQEKWRGSSPG